MNVLNLDKYEEKIIQINPAHWIFIGKLTIDDTSELTKMMNVINFEKEILFDLTGTEYINSSFLGFLIEINQKARAEGGSLLIKSSKNIDKLFSLLHLNDFFNSYTEVSNQAQLN